jgi:hypothetical protein
VADADETCAGGERAKAGYFGCGGVAEWRGHTIQGEE